ncbi:MAG TPA: hypothetical protein PKG48_06455, partial [Bacteroidales bacterium]|nr:hypothetical protein [Bacteroidales bacterium]
MDPPLHDPPPGHLRYLRNTTFPLTTFPPPLHFSSSALRSPGQLPTPASRPWRQASPSLLAGRGPGGEYYF